MNAAQTAVRDKFVEGLKVTEAGKEVLAKMEIEAKRPEAAKRRLALMTELDLFIEPYKDKLPEADEAKELAEAAFKAAIENRDKVYAEFTSETERLERAIAREEAFLLDTAPQKLKDEQARLEEEIRQLPKSVRRYVQESDRPQHEEPKAKLDPLEERDRLRMREYADDGVMLAKAEERMKVDIEKLKVKLDQVKNRILAGEN